MFATKTQILTAVFVAAAAVHAQSTTDTAAPPAGTGAISPCIISCVQPAATANGCDFTDPKCVCASAQFQADAKKCLEDTCTSEEVTAAEGLQAQQCAGISVTGTATTPAPTSAGNSTATDDTTSTPTSTGTGTGTGTGTATKPTATAPGTNTTAPSGTGGANSSAPAPSSTSGAVGVQGLGMGVLAAVAGLIGLVL